MNFFLKILSAFLIIISLVFPIVIREKIDSGCNDIKPVGKRFTIISIIAAILIFVFSCSFVIIPTGYTGVRTTFGQIDSKTVPNGLNLKVPFIQSIELVNNKQQDILFKDKVWSETLNRTAIYYENITVTYQIGTEKSSWIYANVSNYRETLVSQNLVASAIKSSSKSLPDNDATNRSLIEPLTMNTLQESLNQKYGEGVVCVTKVIITNADFEDSYNQAIAAKQQAQLEAEKQSIENKKAVDKATADAEVMKTAAEAQAQAQIITAKAEAEANDLINKSISEQILKKSWLDKWNGQLPQYIGSESSLMLGIGFNSQQ